MPQYVIPTAEWLKLILNEIRAFSDVEFQEKIWLKGEMFEEFRGSYSESMAGLFDDLNFDDFIDLYDKEKYCTMDQFFMLKKIHDELTGYANSSPVPLEPSILLANPKWKKVQLLAQKTLEAFNEKTKVL